MCGIVGYVGYREATDVLIDCLKKLEYRGYDSAGVALVRGNTIDVVKATGRLKVLEEKLRQLGGLPLRHRAHPLGDPWRALGCQQPSAVELPDHPCSQRYYRELSAAEGIFASERLYL